MTKSIGKGTLILVLSGVICKVLGAFFRLPLTSILGIEGIGVFQLVMSVYSFALILTTAGVSTALSKFVSQARAIGDFGKIKSLLKTSLLYSILFGFAGGLALSLLSSQIAFLQGAAAGSSSYKLMLFLIPFGGVIASMRGVFQGYENMTPTAISQILEQAVKFVLGLLFAFIFGKKGVESGVFGAFLGVTMGEIACIIFLCLYMHFKTKFVSVKDKNVAAAFLKAVVPLSLGSSVLPLVSVVDSFVVVSCLMRAGFERGFATSLFGLETGVVGAILNFPLILSSAISTAILPAVAYDEAKLNLDQDNTIANSLKIMWLVLLPLTFGIAAISRPLYIFVYPSLESELIDYAVKLTYFGIISTLITALMQFFVAILQSKGHFYYCMSAYIVGGVIKVTAVIFLTALPQINIFGVVIGNIAFASVVCIMVLIKNKRKVSVGFFDLTLPLISSLLMTLSINALLFYFDLPPLVEVLLSVILGATIYVLCTLPITTEIFKNIFKKKVVSDESS